MAMLVGKIVIITGAGSGIGKQATKVCVREGATVVAVDFSGAEKDTAAEVGENALTKSVAVEYGRQGIRANAIAPGFTFTEFMGEETPLIREMGSKSALGRAGTALELAEVAAFLVSDRASFVTGMVLPVDG